MESRIDILNELKSLSPVIAGMEKVNVFTAPAGYFETLTNNIVWLVKVENGTLINSNTQMQVPQGYFQSLADNILDKIKGENSEIEIVDELSPMLKSIQNKNVFTVPNGYFNTITNTVLHKIGNKQLAMDELQELSPLLQSLQAKNVYTVPEGYFSLIPNKIVNTIAPKQVKVVTMQMRSTAILKYAVAAVFTGVLALGVYKFVGNKTELGSTVKVGMAIAKANTFDAELSKVSDDDIIKYLQENGTDVDAALVASTVDVNELPTQEDYLTDDKALDKYLDNIDINELKN